MRSMAILGMLITLLPFTGCAEHSSHNDRSTDNYSRNDSYRVVKDDAIRTSDTVQNADSTLSVSQANNSAQNIRDRNGGEVTPVDQSNDPKDLDITRRLRRAIMNDDTMSFSARNIKIITVNQVLTLRGPVASAAERDAIAVKARSIPGVLSIDNQLGVTSR